MKEITMSMDQFFNMERGNITLEEIIKENNTESLVYKIINNKKLRKSTITIIAITHIITNPAMAKSNTSQTLMKNFFLSNHLNSEKQLILILIIICSILVFSFGYTTARIVDYIAYYFQDNNK